jgi:uncharacterized surface protein with fasciclin (FAS1) repeats
MDDLVLGLTLSIRRYPMFRRLLSTLVLTSAIALAACSELGTEPVEASAGAVARAPSPGSAPIAAIASEAGFSELVAALSYVDQQLGAGLVDLFQNGKAQFTVFAPTNGAFEDLYVLLGGVLGAEINDVTDIPASVVLDVLLYHVTEGRRAANSVVPRNGERNITSLLGQTFAVRTDATIRDGLTGLRGDASITTADVSASNGIIHVIDAVIVPPSVVAALTN